MSGMSIRCEGPGAGSVSVSGRGNEKWRHVDLFEKSEGEAVNDGGEWIMWAYEFVKIGNGDVLMRRRLET